MTPSKPIRVLATTAVVVLGFGSAGWKYWDYVTNPWTRDGFVMAQVIQVTPRVTGPIVDLPIIDNQFVEAGDLLFQIDPRTFESTLHGMEGLLGETIDEIEALTAQVDATAATIEQAQSDIDWSKQQLKGREARLEDFKAELTRYTELVKTGAASTERVDQAVADVIDTQALVDGAKADLARAEATYVQARADLVRDIANRGAEGDANARLRTAKARVHSAELALEFTTVVAPVDGYITNLDLRLGDHLTANKPALALVDIDSYWVYGFFKESRIRNISVGDRALVTLMSYPDTPIEGRVVGWGWGVYQSDGSTSQQLLPAISAAYEWVRLAQRIPVRVEFDELPEGIELIVGTTASVQVKSGTAEPAGTQASASEAPRVFQ